MSAGMVNVITVSVSTPNLHSLSILPSLRLSKPRQTSDSPPLVATPPPSPPPIKFCQHHFFHIPPFSCPHTCSICTKRDLSCSATQRGSLKISRRTHWHKSRTKGGSLQENLRSVQGKFFHPCTILVIFSDRPSILLWFLFYLFELFLWCYVLVLLSPLPPSLLFSSLYYSAFPVHFAYSSLCTT